MSPYLSGLIQLTIVSGAIHQISFSTFSTLPFAVGSVQDAGLIFLSSMSSNLVKILRKDGADDATILATVTIGLGIYTALLGLALILVGRFRLASYCKLLPSSVVGGYLGYIGFFCGQAGLALMAEVDVSGLTEWGKFLDVDALVLMTPGVIGGFVVYYSVRTFRHMAVLPTCIVMLMIMFYAALWATGTNVRDATEYGWINRNFNDSPAWYHTWEYLRVEKVVWTALPSQALTLGECRGQFPGVCNVRCCSDSGTNVSQTKLYTPPVAMICVVSLSSSLDIAAIEIELRRPLDYNHELKTVGISNIISGLTGGYTGSYIFSQSIFSLKMGIRSRLMGYVLAFTMLAFWMIPIDVLCYVPNFFFGSMLLMICLDLMFEWLIDVRGELTSAEYATVLATFALLQILGLEFGIIAGCVLHFAMLRMGYDIGNDESVNMDDAVAIANYKACNSKREIVRPEGRR
ncbi:hypothetical protein ACHAXA_005168 [Cyclostephanos tholiformis]|uniref:SLC26A/SulP transporter domain-containing protein n=1 Tax=Cyclostephanos tholiformis TaxID=382380 RepID=A0ABD3RF43_9STRA